jgi:hypothetical protein
MAISTAAALITSAVVGAGAAVYSGSQQNKAIKNAQNQATQQNLMGLNYAREARDHAQRILSKYSAEGDAARGRMNAFLGIKPTASGFYAGAMGEAGGASGGPDYEAYVNRDPGLSSEWAKPHVQAQFGGDKAAFGDYHWNTFGQKEQWSPPPVRGAEQAPAAASDPTQVPSETQEEAWETYEASPWGKIGTMEAGKARDDFLSLAGAQGASLSGRTARGMAEVAEESKLRNFERYFGALGGVADTGFNADTGIASGGQQFANTAVNVMGSNARIAADAAMAKGQNQANTMDDLASWIGWGVGNVPGQTQQNTYIPNLGHTTGRSTGMAPRSNGARIR